MFSGVPEPNKPVQSSNALDDLLSLGGNPFADFGAPTTSATDTFATTTTATDNNINSNMWGANGFAGGANVFQQQPTLQAQPFGNANDLSGFFNTNEPSVFDPLGDISTTKSAQIVPQQAVAPQPAKAAPAKILTGDLESSLTSLVENLTMDSGKYC